MTGLKRFDALIFDLGNTLIYCDKDWPALLPESNRVLLASLQAAGLALEGERFLHEFLWRETEYFAGRDVDFVEYTTGAILRATLVDFGYPDVPDSVLRPALRAMYAVTQAHWLPEVEAVPTLQALRQQGYRMGLLSNAGDDADVQTLVDKAELRSYLDFIVSSAAQGIRKPNPRIFRAALAHWQFIPARVAMIGDMLGADILGAHNAGLFGIWITGRADNDQNRAHLDTIRPDATITTLSDLPGLLSELSATPPLY